MRTVALLVALAAALDAAPPSIREIYPRGAQRGKSLTVYLRGDGLAQGAQVKTTLPGSFSRLTLSRDPLSESGAAMARPGTVLPFLLTIKADAPTGIYPVRVLTPEGVSNVVLFSVGELPEMEELESKNPKQPNNFANEAQKVTVPAVINGTLDNADVDQYVFTAQAGQKLVFEVEARRTGSAIDPALEIYDAGGREIARNDDATGAGVDSRVEVSFARAGEYRVQIHDSKFSEQVQNFYRLKIGSYAYATAVFPLGGRRGESVDVTLSGGNLPQPVKVKAEAPAKGAWFAVRVPGSPSLPIYLAASDDAETFEETSPELKEGNVVNGRIAKAGEVDRFKLSVTPGEKWVLEVTAASLGISELDGLLTLYDAAGKKLAGADDGNGPDPVLPFTVPKGVSEISVALEDLLGRGGQGFGYRLVARRQEPDFVAELLTPFVNVPAGGTAQVACLIQRRGYDGVIKLKIPDLPPGFQVAGGHVPSEATAQNFNNDNAGRRTARSVLTITAPAGAEALFREL
ncbi:MAG: PPC domain-containing protein, partial [Bryobacteraceae bacterium]